MRREKVIRNMANGIIAMGLFLLLYTLYSAVSGSLALRVFAGDRGPWIYNLYALGLILPVPFHIISIGLVLKRKWLSSFWARAAWPAILVSGCWLAAGIGMRLMRP